MRKCRNANHQKNVSLLLAAILVVTVLTVGVVPAVPKASAASWNGYNYSVGQLYGYRTFLQAFGIDYDVYMKWMDDHDADSSNPDYYLGTPYAHNDHRNPRGDCDGARGAYDTPGVAALNCTGFVWHVLYKSAVHSGASSEQISRLKVMWQVPVAWSDYGVYRVWFDSIEDAYESGILEKGDLMWIYGSSDNHNAIFYGDSPRTSSTGTVPASATATVRSMRSATAEVCGSRRSPNRTTSSCISTPPRAAAAPGSAPNTVSLTAKPKRRRL